MSTAFRTRARWVTAAGGGGRAGPAGVAATLKSGFTEVTIASGLADPDRHGVCAGRATVCLQAVRAVARHREQPAPANAVCLAHRQLVGRARTAGRGLRPELRRQPVRVRLLHGDRRRRFTTGSAASRPTATSPSPAASSSCSTCRRSRRPITTAARCTSASTASCTSPSATTPSARTPRRSPTRWARCCASTPTARSRRTTRSSARRPGSASAIWALGLRNPFTFSFQPTSGRMFINDVGQNTWEEINEGAAGANYGWPTTEGADDQSRLRDAACTRTATAPARFQGCAITGGAFYAGLPAQFPAEYVGDYFFADYCSGWINRLDDSSGAVDHVRLWHLVSRRPGGRARGQPLLPRARIVGCRRAHRLHGQPGARDHAAPGQSHRLDWSIRQLHRRRVGRSAAVVSVAARWHAHQRRHQRDIRAADDDVERQRRAVPGGRHQRVWHGDQQRRDADRRRQSAAGADDHHSGLRRAVLGRHDAEPTRAPPPIRRMAPCPHSASRGGSTSTTTRTRIRSSRRRPDPRAGARRSRRWVTRRRRCGTACTSPCPTRRGSRPRPSGTCSLGR